jgi:hypothetical protein
MAFGEIRKGEKPDYMLQQRFRNWQFWQAHPNVGKKLSRSIA